MRRQVTDDNIIWRMRRQVTDDDIIWRMRRQVTDYNIREIWRMRIEYWVTEARILTLSNY
jgi:hypothetical protein